MKIEMEFQGLKELKMCIRDRNTAREENADAIEIMQVWEVDSAVNEDVRGV